MKKGIVSWIAKGLLLLGGLELGLMGAFNFDLVKYLLGFVGATMYANVAFILIGLATIYEVFCIYKYKSMK